MKLFIILTLLFFLAALIFKTLTSRLKRFVRESVQDVYYAKPNPKGEVLYDNGKVKVMKQHQRV
jgi:hypothetical protein